MVDKRWLLDRQASVPELPTLTLAEEDHMLSEIVRIETSEDFVEGSTPTPRVMSRDNLDYRALLFVAKEIGKKCAGTEEFGRVRTQFSEILESLTVAGETEIQDAPGCKKGRTKVGHSKKPGGAVICEICGKRHLITRCAHYQKFEEVKREMLTVLDGTGKRCKICGLAHDKTGTCPVLKETRRQASEVTT
jgi:hypothetical protein